MEEWRAQQRTQQRAQQRAHQRTRGAIRAVRAIQRRAVENRRVGVSDRAVDIVVVAGNDEKEDDTPFCRFCFEEDNPSNRLITPCTCRGSQEWIHTNCLTLWRERWPPTDVRHTHCPVCTAVWTVPGPRTLNLGKKYIVCSWVYLLLLAASNLNTIVWFVLLETSMGTESNVSWCLPATLGVGMANSIVNAVATTHLTNRLKSSELSVGFLLFLLNAGAFCSQNMLFVFSVCWGSFAFAVWFVIYPFRRSFRNGVCQCCPWT